MDLKGHRQRGRASPSSEARRAAGLYSFILIVTILAGCLGTPGDGSPQLADDGEPPGRAANNASAYNAEWPVQLNLTPTFTAGFAQPFHVYSADNKCDTYSKVHVPENATRLSIVLTGDPGEPLGQNDSGYMAFMANAPGVDDPLDPDDGEHGSRFPNGTVAGLYPGFSKRVVLDVGDPLSGMWQIWVWPNKRIANQQWNLTIRAEGAGEGSRNMTLEPLAGQYDKTYRYCEATKEGYDP